MTDRIRKSLAQISENTIQCIRMSDVVNGDLEYMRAHLDVFNETENSESMAVAKKNMTFTIERMRAIRDAVRQIIVTLNDLEEAEKRIYRNQYKLECEDEYENEGEISCLE